MVLFVAAANGRIRAANIRPSGFPIEESRWEIVEMAPPRRERVGTLHEEEEDLAPLSRGLSVLCHHYTGDERQRSIWYKVVAFHAMMVKTRGSAVERWTTGHEGQVSLTSSHSAVGKGHRGGAPFRVRRILRPGVRFVRSTLRSRTFVVLNDELDRVRF